MIELNKIYNVDCFEGLKRLKDNSIHCIITDPPYNVGKKGVDNGTEVLKQSIGELYRVLKDNSYFITYVSIAKISEVITYVTQVGFKYKWMYIVYWSNINNILPSPIGRCVYAPVLIFTKGKPKRLQYLIDVSKQVIKVGERKLNHPTPKPVDVNEKLLLLSSKEGQICLDPFMGSGSTAIACIRKRRYFIGFEINEEYCKVAEDRIKREISEVMADENAVPKVTTDGIPPKDKSLGILPTNL